MKSDPTAGGRPSGVLLSRLLKVVGGVLAGALLAQLVLGWGAGVRGSWIAVLLVAMMVAALVMVDAGRGGAGSPADEPYDIGACAVVGLTVGAAAACLYLPLPWGGLGAAAIFMALVARGVSEHRRRGSSDDRRQV